MNRYDFYLQQQVSYGPDCQYRNTCPVRTQCPYCPHQMENGLMNPDLYSNANGKMEYYMKNNLEPFMVPYENMVEEYGYDNLYPLTVNAGMANEEAQPTEPLYNELGYISPDEFVNSPWDNNRMHEMDPVNINPLLINCPYR